MKNTRFATGSMLLTLTLSLSAGLAAADDKKTQNEDKNEIVVFGGVSLLDASRSAQDEFLAAADVPALVGSRSSAGRLRTAGTALA